jgi:hypothetical protein
LLPSVQSSVTPGYILDGFGLIRYHLLLINIEGTLTRDNDDNTGSSCNSCNSRLLSSSAPQASSAPQVLVSTANRTSKSLSNSGSSNGTITYDPGGDDCGDNINIVDDSTRGTDDNDCGNGNGNNSSRRLLDSRAAPLLHDANNRSKSSIGGNRTTDADDSRSFGM